MRRLFRRLFFRSLFRLAGFTYAQRVKLQFALLVMIGASGAFANGDLVESGRFGVLVNSGRRSDLKSAALSFLFQGHRLGAFLDRPNPALQPTPAVVLV